MVSLYAWSGRPLNVAYVNHDDADNQRLMYSYWDGVAWNTEVVDEAGDVGGYNDLVLVGNMDSEPRIAYWDATIRRVKLAVPDPNIGFWTIYPNLAGPSLDADSGPLSMAVLPEGDIGVAYYDGVSGNLRVGTWHAETATWTDEQVDGASADVGQLNSLQTDGTEGAPVVAYLGQGAIRFANKVGGLWQTQDVPSTEGVTVTSLSLELGLNSRRHARIAYTTDPGALKVALLRNGIWQTEEVAASGVSALQPVSAARDSRLHLAYIASLSGLQYAFRTANLDVDLTVTEDPPPSFFGDGYYNPLDACQALLDLFFGDTAPSRGLPARQLTVGRSPDGALGDLALFGAMTDTFNASAEGQYYVDLYRQHGSEMGQLGLDDPGLLWDSYGALQNFLPGLEGLVTGRGEEFVVTQDMVDDALDIWQRLAAAGSPELAGVINAELAKYNNLQDFVGMSFDEWAEAIGVPTPELIYLPLISK